MNKYWKSKECYEKIFGKDVKMDSIQVLELQTILASLPEQDVYSIIAYGSLMNRRDMQRTLPKTSHRFLVAIFGYMRIFNIGWKESGSFLNIKPTTQEDMLICVGICVNAEDLPKYIAREGLYDIKFIKFNALNVYGNIITNKDNIPIEYTGLTVINDQDDYGIEPQLNYFHLCLTGIREELGKLGVDNFLDTTLCYSIKENEYVTGREWLKTLDLTNYFIQHDYSNR